MRGAVSLHPGACAAPTRRGCSRGSPPRLEDGARRSRTPIVPGIEALVVGAKEPCNGTGEQLRVDRWARRGAVVALGEGKEKTPSRRLTPGSGAGIPCFTTNLE